jgi:hypothetical protein
VTLIGATIIITVCASTAAVFKDDICVSNVLGISYNQSEGVVTGFILLAATIWPVTVLASFLLRKVVMKLNELKEKSRVSAEDKKLIVVTKYVVITFGLLNISFILAIPMIAYTILHPRLVPAVNFALKFCSILLTLQGLINVFVYGYLNPKYMEKVKEVLRMRKLKNRVEPT